MMDLDAIDDRAQQGYPASCLETLDMTAEIRRLRELCGEAAGLLFTSADWLALRAGQSELGRQCDAVSKELRAASKGEL